MIPFDGSQFRATCLFDGCTLSLKTVGWLQAVVCDRGCRISNFLINIEVKLERRVIVVAFTESEPSSFTVLHISHFNISIFSTTIKPHQLQKSATVHSSTCKSHSYKPQQA
jgi:hypothetical protein